MNVRRYYKQFVTAVPTFLEPCPSQKRTVESFSDVDCAQMFRIDKVSLTRLYSHLLFENRNRLPYGHVMSGEEIFLRGLFELSTGSLQQIITRDFVGYQPHQSMAFTFFVDTFSDLVTNNLE